MTIKIQNNAKSERERRKKELMATKKKKKDFMNGELQCDQFSCKSRVNLCG